MILGYVLAAGVGIRFQAYWLAGQGERAFFDAILGPSLWLGLALLSAGVWTHNKSRQPWREYPPRTRRRRALFLAGHAAAFVLIAVLRVAIRLFVSPDLLGLLGPFQLGAWSVWAALYVWYAKLTGLSWPWAVALGLSPFASVLQWAAIIVLGFSKPTTPIDAT